MSGNPFKKGDQRFAGTEKTPEQSVIPKEVAEEFLSKDGTYWQAWREVDSAEAIENLNIFRIKQKFAYPTAIVAMRVPYTPTLNTAFVEQLEKSRFPGVIVHHAGKSKAQRDLTIIEISDPDVTADVISRPVVLLYGAEDGDEPDGAWVVQGAINWLISDDPQATVLRKQMTFLCIPLLDPDGAADCTYAKMTYDFAMKKADAAVRPEVLAYTKFVTSWMASGKRLDLVGNYHNVECGEIASNVLCPIIDIRHAAAVTALNRFVLDRLTSVQTNKQTWMTGFADDRFMGWCSKHWGSLQIAYEISSRYPNNRLTLMQLQELGGSYVRAFGEYLQSDIFKAVLPEIETVRQKQLLDRQHYWTNRDDPDETRTACEMVTLGY